jgi:hypothetical protein
MIEGEHPDFLTYEGLGLVLESLSRLGFEWSFKQSSGRYLAQVYRNKKVLRAEDIYTGFHKESIQRALLGAVRDAIIEEASTDTIRKTWTGEAWV